jgi:hypothetical protein
MQLKKYNRFMLITLLCVYFITVVAFFELFSRWQKTFTPDFDPAIMPYYAGTVVHFGLIVLLLFLFQVLSIRKLNKMSLTSLSLIIPVRLLTFKSIFICLVYLVILFFLFFTHEVAMMIELGFTIMSVFSLGLATLYTYLLMNLTIRGNARISGNSSNNSDSDLSSISA